MKASKSKPFYSLDNKIAGENYKSKIDKIAKILKLNKLIIYL